MIELKYTFEDETELADHCIRLRRSNSFALAFDQIDDNFRSMVKHSSDETLSQMVRVHCETEPPTIRDAIDMCRSILNETLRDNKIDLYE